VLFNPVPEVKELIKKTMKELRLTLYRYVLVHIRTSDIRLPNKINNKNYMLTLKKVIEVYSGKDLQSNIKKRIDNFISCTHNGNKNLPIYFTSNN